MLKQNIQGSCILVYLLCGKGWSDTEAEHRKMQLSYQYSLVANWPFDNRRNTSIHYTVLGTCL